MHDTPPMYTTRPLIPERRAVKNLLQATLLEEEDLFGGEILRAKIVRVAAPSLEHVQPKLASEIVAGIGVDLAIVPI